jgi:predicted  nucleic acid-binding Zn-ribbon protein
MKKSFDKFMKGVLIAFLIIGMASTAKAKKAKKDKEPYLGPTVEECKTRKNGDEKCNIKKLHGQKAIEFIYQALLESNAAIAENAENIASLTIDTSDLQEQIDGLRTEISDNDGEIAANAENISNLFIQLASLQAVSTEQTQELLNIKEELLELESISEAQAIVVQGQIDYLQEQITANNNTMLASMGPLQELVDSQGILLQAVQNQIVELDEKIDIQVELLQDAIALVQSNLEDEEFLTNEQFGYATDQRTLILADIVALQIAREDLHDRADGLNEDIEANESAIADLKTDLDGRISSINSEISGIKSTIVSLEARLLAAEGTLVLLESMHSDPQCSEPYTTITDARRNVTTTGGPYVCDNGLATGWYRFSGAAGSYIPLSAPAKYSCGTHAPGWMNGSLPSESDGIVARQVCYNWNGSCSWPNNIKVVNCGDFFLYELVKPIACHVRYCGTN